MHKPLILGLVLIFAGAVIYFIFNGYGFRKTTEEVKPSATPSLALKSFDWGSLKYINTVDWPPEITTLDKSYSCNQAGEVTQRARKTEEKSIDGKKYCVTEEDEGAAGSIYHQYAYKTSYGNKSRIMTFSLRQVQCGNYPEPQKTECAREQAGFDINKSILYELKKLGI